MEDKKAFCKRAEEFKPEMIKTSKIIEDLMSSVEPENFIKWVRNDVLCSKYYDYSKTGEFKAKYPNYDHNNDERFDACKDVKAQLEELGFVRTDDVFGAMNSLCRFFESIGPYVRGCENSFDEFYKMIRYKKVFPTAVIDCSPGHRCVSNSVYEVYDENSVKEQFSTMLHSYLTPLQYELVCYILFNRGGHLVALSSIEQDILFVAARQVYSLMPEFISVLKKSLS